MHTNLLRKDFYLDNYRLNNQEFKEFYFTPITPYWILRSECYSRALDMLGTKQELSKRVQEYYFENQHETKLKTKALKKVSSINLEKIIKSLNFSTEIHQNQQKVVSNDKLEKNRNKFYWEVVPEMSIVKKFHSYD